MDFILTFNSKPINNTKEFMKMSAIKTIIVPIEP